MDLMFKTMKMTFNEALLIQKAQMVYYRQSIGRKGVKAIIAKTIYPSNINPNKKIPVREINELVPRGGSFESLFTKNRFKFKHCKDASAWHDAIRRGLV